MNTLLKILIGTRKQLMGMAEKHVGLVAALDILKTKKELWRRLARGVRIILKSAGQLKNVTGIKTETDIAFYIENKPNAKGIVFEQKR